MLLGSILLAWVVHVSLTLIWSTSSMLRDRGMNRVKALLIHYIQKTRSHDPIGIADWLIDGWWWRGCLAWLPGSMSSLSLMQIRVKVVVFLARSFYWGKLASRPILCNILNLEIWIFILPPCTIMVYCNLPQLEIVFALVTEVLILLDTERLT